jgi:ATP-dependent Clp endopeptidase proteolytic subunit ClpP
MFSKGIKIDTKRGVAEVIIYDRIGQVPNPETGKIVGVSGVDFASDIMIIDSMEEVKRIEVRINSVGGSVFEGWSIFSAIIRAKTPVHTFCDGIAASIAGIIFMAGKKRHMVDFGRVMIHDPSIKGQALTPEQTAMIESTRGALLTVLNGNSKVSPEQMSQMMAAETWLNASECLSKGLADKIIKTDRVFNESDSLESIMSLSNTYISQKNKPKMEKILAHLGMEQSSTQENVVNAITGVQTKLTDANADVEKLTNEVEASKTEVETLKNEKAELLTKLATSTVEAAINKGVFAEDKKADLIKQCENDFDGFTGLVAAFKVPVAKVTNVIDTKEKPKKSLRELEKENPTEVQRLINEEPEEYKALYKSEYGVETEM